MSEKIHMLLPLEKWAEWPRLQLRSKRRSLMELKEEDLKRFWNKVEIKSESECWIWQAATANKGYGVFTIFGRPIGAHRFALYTRGVFIPKGSCACHVCDNPPCCNPAHLFVGNMSDNIKDMVGKGRENWAKGEGKPNTSILSEADVIEARRIRKESGMTFPKLAALFGVGRTTILNAINGQTWKHI